MESPRRQGKLHRDPSTIKTANKNLRQNIYGHKIKILLDYHFNMWRSFLKANTQERH